MTRPSTRLLSLLALGMLLCQSATAIPGPSPIPPSVVGSSGPSKQIRILNEKEPGAVVDILNSLVPKRTNVVVFFADW